MGVRQTRRAPGSAGPTSPPSDYPPEATCAGACGSPDPTEWGCYCNETCPADGTCCPDGEALCAGQQDFPDEATCDGACQGHEPTEWGCYCDDACRYQGDCCPDAGMACGMALSIETVSLDASVPTDVRIRLQDLGSSRSIAWLEGPAGPDGSYALARLHPEPSGHASLTVWEDDDDLSHPDGHFELAVSTRGGTKDWEFTTSVEPALGCGSDEVVSPGSSPGDPVPVDGFVESDRDGAPSLCPGETLWFSWEPNAHDLLPWLTLLSWDGTVLALDIRAGVDDVSFGSAVFQRHYLGELEGGPHQPLLIAITAPQGGSQAPHPYRLALVE